MASEHVDGEPVPGSPNRGRSATVLTAGVVVLVLVLVVVLVIVKATQSPPPATGEAPTPAPASVVQPLTHIPASVYDRVGVSAPGLDVSAPHVVHGSTTLLYAGHDGALLPGVLSVAAEYCAYCAAERWAEVAALSRFGSFTNLQASQSATGQAFGQTPTISFRSASFRSRYVALQAVETAGVEWQPLARPSGAERRTMAQADLVRYGAPGLPTSLNGRVVPFLDIAGRGVIVGGSFSPAVLQGLSRDQIAGDLSDPTQPTTKAIVAAANYISAVLSAATHQQPGRVCHSSGVEAADAAMHLTG